MNQNGPEKAYGKSVRVSLWRNSGPKGPFITFRLERRYKDPTSGDWKSSATFTLPQAMRMHALLGRAIADNLDQDEDAASAA
jgi:hypothetical protein